MTHERRALPAETAIWSVVRKDPDDGAVGTLWTELSARLDATPQKSRQAVVLPWSAGLPGVPRMWPRVPGPAIAVLALAACLAVAAVAGIVASRHRLPPPIGIAKPGLIAFDGSGDIFVSNADGTGLQAITDGPADDVQPTWSPDGTMIAFWSLAPGQVVAHLSIVDADGSHLRTVATKDVSVGISGSRTLEPYEIAWSPDDRWLAFTGGTSLDLEVVVAAADGTGSSVVGDPGFESQLPTWSPDGSKIAFRGGRADQDRGLYTMNADGTGVHRLTDEGEAIWGSTYSYLHPAWSPDGLHVAYVSAAGPADAFSSGWNPTRIWVVDADGTNERIVSIDDSGSDFPAWSPDGSRIVYLRSMDAEPFTAVVVNADGSDPINLGNQSGGWIPHWSPDGTAILSTVVAESGSGLDIVVSPLDSGPIVRFRAHTFTSGAELGGGDLSWQRLAP